MLDEKMYFPVGSGKPKNYLVFAQFHSSQTELMKNETMKQLQGPDKLRSTCVVFAMVTVGIGVNIHNMKHVIHISVPRTIESYYHEIGCTGTGTDFKTAKASMYYNRHNISIQKPGI